jgi:hypothetical protein
MPQWAQVIISDGEDGSGFWDGWGGFGALPRLTAQITTNTNNKINRYFIPSAPA